MIILVLTKELIWNSLKNAWQACAVLMYDPSDTSFMDFGLEKKVFFFILENKLWKLIKATP